MASLQDILAAKKASKSPNEIAQAKEASEASPEPSSPLTPAPVAVSPKKEIKSIPSISPIPSIPSDISQEHYEILEKIRGLTEIPDENLASEMDELKKSLLANPAAVSLMLPEDIGAMVEALRKVVGEAIAVAKAPKEKKAKKQTLDADALQAAFDEL